MYCGCRDGRVENNRRWDAMTLRWGACSTDKRIQADTAGGLRCNIDGDGMTLLLLYCGEYKNQRSKRVMGDAAFCSGLAPQNKSINKREEQSSKEYSRSIVHATRCKNQQKRGGVANV